MKAFPLYEGSYTVDASKKFVPFDPLTQDPLTRKGSVFVHIYPFLIETADELILLDTGLGQLNEDGELKLHVNIRKAGYDPSQVSKVIMSHLHSDHSLGLVIPDGNSFRPSFPDADIYIQKNELATALEDRPSSYPRRQVQFIIDHARIRGQTIIFTEVMKCLKVPLSFAIILLNMIMMGEKAGIFGPGISKGRLKKGGNAYFIMTSHQDQ